MTRFNTYEGDGDGLTRKVVTHVDLTTLSLDEWTLDELGFRLAVIYPQVDGYGHLTASTEVKAEVWRLLSEIQRRGYDPTSNLRLNERVTGFGWQPGFRKLDSDA